MLKIWKEIKVIWIAPQNIDDEKGKYSDPVTYGDIKLNEEGDELPAETVLTHSSDSMVATSIDYIFKVRISNYFVAWKGR